MESERKSFPELKIPKVSIGEIAPHGELFQRSLSVGALRDLDAADEEGDLPADELASLVIVALICTGDDAPLSREEVGALDADARHTIVRAIIAKNRDWFVEDRNEKGNGTDLAKLCVPMEQGKEESDEEFLARGVRAELAAKEARLKGMLNGLSERMQGVIGPSLVANMGASRSLSHLLDSMRPEPATLRIPELPRNPIHDTNEILGEVASQIGQMRDLAAATAEMQRTLNATASAAVTDFSAGADKSFTAAKQSLKIAKATLAATILAAFVSVVALCISVMSINSQNAGVETRQAALQMQTERLTATQTELVRRIGELPPVINEMPGDASAAAKAEGK
ncbi:hypothetical protein [Sphingosinicella sp.]|uniref:hypothetical protein n=1 Tax=Sphingosinicella sp. TaxID=1917971 RepID=UPI0035B17418